MRHHGVVSIVVKVRCISVRLPHTSECEQHVGNLNKMCDIFLAAATKVPHALFNTTPSWAPAPAAGAGGQGLGLLRRHKSGCHTSGGVTHTVTRTRSGPCSPHRTTPAMPALGVTSGVANADDLGIGASVASSPQRLRRLQDWVVHEHPQHTWCRMWPEQLRATQPEAQARFLSMVATTRHRQHSTHLIRG